MTSGRTSRPASRRACRGWTRRSARAPCRRSCPARRSSNDPARAPYWTVPDVGDGSLAFTAPRYQSVSVRSCAGDTFPLVGKAVLARLGPGARWYVMPQLADVQAGAFVADNCADATHYPLSPDVAGRQPLRLASPFRRPRRRPSTSRSMSRFRSTRKVSGAYAMCASCDFDQDGCAPINRRDQDAGHRPVLRAAAVLLERRTDPVRCRQHAVSDVLAMTRTVAAPARARRVRWRCGRGRRRRARTMARASTRGASSGRRRAGLSARELAAVGRHRRRGSHGLGAGARCHRSASSCGRG